MDEPATNSCLWRCQGITGTLYHNYKFKCQQIQLHLFLDYSYVPKIALKEKSVQKIPFFKGVAFAALSPQMRPEVEKEFLVSDVMGIPDQDTENLVFAELVFMTMAEQISRYYPFTYEQKIPRTHKTGSSVMPMTIDGFGDCRFLSDNKNETLQMYFNFKTTDTILKFDLNFYQFRSLLLSEFLFNNKYCA